MQSVNLQLDTGRGSVSYMQRGHSQLFIRITVRIPQEQIPDPTPGNSAGHKGLRILVFPSLFIFTYTCLQYIMMTSLWRIGRCHFIPFCESSPCPSLHLLAPFPFAKELSAYFLSSILFFIYIRG